MSHTTKRRACNLSKVATPLSPRPQEPRQEATIVELGPDALVLQSSLGLALSELVAVDSTLSGQATELHAIAKVVVVGPAQGSAVCELTFLPELERGLIRAWLDRDPDPRPAARLRVG